MKRETNWFLSISTICLCLACFVLLVKVVNNEGHIGELKGKLTLQSRAIRDLKCTSCNLPEKPHKMLSRALVEAVVTVESSGNPKAYNKHSGAVGLMQLTEIVYKKICGLTKAEAFEPRRNVACGTLFLNHLLFRFNNLEKALVFYNNGHTIKNKKYYRKVVEKLSNNEQ